MRLRSAIEWRLINGWPGRIARRAVTRHPLITGGDEGRVRLGRDVVLNDALLNVGSGTITIGDASFLGHGVTLLARKHDMRRRGLERQHTVPPSGHDIVIGRGVWIATNATVIGPCTIGDDAVVAAGAVVTRDVAPATLVGGVPARPLRGVDDERR